MSKRLEGRTAIVTGAGRGIGRGVALLLAAEGASVVVNDYGVNVDGSAPTSGPAQEVADEIRSNGGKAVANFDNVAEVASGERMVQTALDEFGRLDILINVAGILRDRMIFNMSEQEWDDVIAVHLKGHFCTTKPASIVMRQQRHGRIINFSSISGLGGLPGQANYGAAKAGIAGFTRVVARDLGRYGVTCNAISPGAATRMTATIPQNTAQLRARAGTAPVVQEAPRRSTVPSMREPEYVAPMTVFLACDEAWNINGKIFYVAGGRISLAHEETPMRQIIKNGMWSIDELRELVPSQLMYGLQNPAPPPPDLDLPGRPAVPATA
ncbi:MAG: SDR family oxidoreductase [Chloroflexota bacterium]|nr:SDR family oxidoreductase [Chloroflexota bacterium]